MTPVRREHSVLSAIRDDVNNSKGLLSMTAKVDSAGVEGGKEEIVM